MPKHIHNALTPVEARSLASRKPGRYADGGGLYLHVTGPGQAKWSLRYMLHGKAREMGLGAAYRPGAEGKPPIAIVSLADARLAAKAARVKIETGVDPLAERAAEENARRVADEARKAAALAASPARTFRSAFEGWLEAHGPAMRTERQRVQAKQLMARHVFPSIGNKPVNAVTTADMMEVLQPIWRTKPETALRARIRCEAVFAWAIAHGWREGRNPAVWSHNLKPLLGEQGEAANVKHRNSLRWSELPTFMRRLESENCVSALAMRWTVATAARTIETIGAMWDEVHLDAPGGPVWVVPAWRMKEGSEHRVPLNSVALSVLEEARKIRGTLGNPVFLFPGAAGSRGGRLLGGRLQAIPGGMSNMAMLGLLRRMGASVDATTHGFRATFKTWCQETRAAPDAVVEKALAHAVGDEVVRAYGRSDFFDMRRILMQRWAEFLTSAPATVTDLDEERAKRAVAR
ncbi:tyrosine-type recombinase/integrase [Falsiroseomonas sp. HW251]|uniref:tyrosine-type recombinase/integrase n=1 Tax=Falsiroseomonas sp. HW251 TaxID=3390998 RepID=UPI003D318564